MSTFQFHDPVWLLVLVPAFLAVWASRRRRRGYAIVFSSLEGLRDLPVTLAQRFKRWLPALRFAGLVFLAGALARPQQGRVEYRVRTEGIAIEMVIDRSGSMRALDFEEDGKRVNRLHIVKKVFRDFVAGDDDLEGRPDDQIGLVAFGGYAESLCPLTLDHGALLEVLKGLEIPEPLTDSAGNILNRDFFQEELSTAIGDALAVGVDRLQEVEAKSRIVILLSDGSNTAGLIEPLDAAQAAKALGVKVYTIGVGTTGRVPIPSFQTDRFGRRQLVAQEVELDEKTLTQIAETTGARYFNAQDEDALREVYETIGELETTEIESLMYTEYRELFAWWLVPGLSLLFLELLLRCTRFASLP